MDSSDCHFQNSPTIPCRPPPRYCRGWDREHFIYETEYDRYVCPRGQPRRRLRDNVAFRQQGCPAPLRVGASRPVRQACDPGLRARTVTRSADHELLEAARPHMQPAAARAALRKRKQFIEPVFAGAGVRQCLARARKAGAGTTCCPGPGLPLPR